MEEGSGVVGRVVRVLYGVDAGKAAAMVELRAVAIAYYGSVSVIVFLRQPHASMGLAARGWSSPSLGCFEPLFLPPSHCALFRPRTSLECVSYS